MFVLEIADLKIGIDNKYEYIETLCKDYIISADKTDFDVSASDEEINAEQTENFPLGYLESLAVYRKIAEKITDYNGILMHSAVIKVDDTAIAFLARSGTGKTTHITRWKQFLGDRVSAVNGDKPLIRIIDGKAYAYGTPWAGKENLQTNTKAELKKICFVERAKENACIPVSGSKSLERLLNQIYIDKGYKAFGIIGKLMEICDFYIIECNMDISAAKVAYEGMGL